METAYYDLSGGINQGETKTVLGLNTKRIFWTDSYNIEILQNKGICRQKGNTLLLQIPVDEPIIAMHEMNNSKLIIITQNGKLYIHNFIANTTTLLNKTLSGNKISFANFLQGTVIISEADYPFYINNNLEISDCNLTNNGNNLYATCVCVYKGRVWFGADSTIYYSALGTYNDFTTTDDAGYISDFHTNTDKIIAIKTYKNYLAIYKNNNVYLLSGSNQDDFVIIPFADKGCIAEKSIVNVDNKQYFLSNGIFALEQVGELNQIQLGSEISLKIKPEIEALVQTDLSSSFCLHYENKNQIWYFFPYTSNNYYQTIWINDYVNKAWYKRKIPQNITTACLFNGSILSADSQGKIYKEYFGTTFDGNPINFMWKSPFLSIGSAHHKKLIDEFYFILDEAYDNNFNFSVYKDYDGEYADDAEKIYSVHLEHLIWSNSDTNDNLPCHWALDEESTPIWSVSHECLEKAEISEANYSIQLCIEGNEIENNCAIIGLQFREIYNDD